jgi:MFS family permease
VAGRIANALGALRAVLAFCALAAAATALGFLGTGTLVETLFVSLLYAALVCPLTTTAGALALEAAAPDGAGRGFEYGWVRGCGSAALMAGTVLAGQVIAAIGLQWPQHRKTAGAFAGNRNPSRRAPRNAQCSGPQRAGEPFHRSRDHGRLLAIWEEML